MDDGIDPYTGERLSCEMGEHIAASIISPIAFSPTRVVCRVHIVSEGLFAEASLFFSLGWTTSLVFSFGAILRVG